VKTRPVVVTLVELMNWKVPVVILPFVALRFVKLAPVLVILVEFR